MHGSRNPGGRPESESDTKFFDLRESGYTGPINHNGEKVTTGREVDILQALAQARGETLDGRGQ